MTAAAVSLVSLAACSRSSSWRIPTAPVHSSAARAVSTGQPRASSKASKRGASPARSTKCDSPSARSVKVRTTRVWGVAMREYTLLRYQLRLRLDLHDPQARIDVRNIDQPVPVDRTPGIWRIGDHSVAITGDDMGHFPPLPKQVASELAGDIEHAEP